MVFRVFALSFENNLDRVRKFWMCCAGFGLFSVVVVAFSEL